MRSRRIVSETLAGLRSRVGPKVIRLPVCWAAVQPQPGSEGFDQGYLDRVVDLVQRCAKVGIYV